MITKEYNRPQVMGAGSTFRVNGINLAGFLCTVAGSMTITDQDGTILVNALPLTAGTFVRIPLLFNSPSGGTVALTTAAGTLFI